MWCDSDDFDVGEEERGLQPVADGSFCKFVSHMPVSAVRNHNASRIGAAAGPARISAPVIEPSPPPDDFSASEAEWTAKDGNSTSTLLATWRKRRQRCRSQIFGVVRHTERADAPWARLGGDWWFKSEDFEAWPMDPPLSDSGIEAAEGIGAKFCELAQEQGCSVHVVVSSPYFRCVQTAVEICRKIGSGVRMLVDLDLGEVFGPCVMSPDEPLQTVRPKEELLAYCRRRGVDCSSTLLGRWPEWPESMVAARVRFIGTFLAYLRRSVSTLRNFVIVTHADGVGSMLSMMPSIGDNTIEKVEYGGMVFASRRLQAQCQGGVNSRADALESEGDSGTINAELLGVGVEEPREASARWLVITDKIVLRRQRDVTTTFNMRLEAFARHSGFSREQIESLVGRVSVAPLGGNGELKLNTTSSARMATRTMTISTLLFGASSSDVTAELEKQARTSTRTWSQTWHAPKKASSNQSDHEVNMAVAHEAHRFVSPGECLTAPRRHSHNGSMNQVAATGQPPTLLNRLHNSKLLKRRASMPGMTSPPAEL